MRRGRMRSGSQDGVPYALGFERGVLEYFCSNISECCRIAYPAGRVKEHACEEAGRAAARRREELISDSSCAPGGAGEDLNLVKAPSRRQYGVVLAKAHCCPGKIPRKRR